MQLIYRFLNTKYHQNYILKSPYLGAVIIFVFCFGFLFLYKPHGTHEAQHLSYTATMAIYCFVIAVSAVLFIQTIKKIKYFSDCKDWTLLKELISIVLVLFGIGIAIYFTAFLVEVPAHRWNFPTFFDSCQEAFLIGIVPFLFFSIVNYRSFGMPTIIPLENEPTASTTECLEKSVEIISKLKKEKLSFIPSQLLYATSDGNYVVFYLNRNNKVEKEIIRNAISEIDQQLSQIPFLMRTHRAFIVNMKEVRMKKGNMLGYQLKISGIEHEIPVSRQYTHAFNQLFNLYH